MTRRTDGSAGAADSDATDQDLGRYRRPEPSFARAITKALGGAGTVLDVGIGDVSYAPVDRRVTGAPEAEDLPFADDTFDGAMTAFSVHRWPDLERGFAEVRRVTRGPIVVLTRDPDRVRGSWLAEYAPEVTAAVARGYPTIARIADALADDTVTRTVLPIPFTCVDGFAEAYYARPERLLDAATRRADPAWSLVDEMTARRSVAALRAALESGDWDRAHGALRTQPTYDGSLVLLTATPG